MDPQLNLSHLSEEECQKILNVIQRDFSLRQQEKDRLEELEAEIKEENLRSEILAKGQKFNKNCCVRCFSQFILFFNPKVQCVVCTYYVCKKCSTSQQKENICNVCKKHQELEVLSNSWFYTNVGERFRRFGSAKVVRSMHQRKQDSDVESDSGYNRHSTLDSIFGSNDKKQSTTNNLLNKSASLSEKQRTINFGDVDVPSNILSIYRKKFNDKKKEIEKLQNDEKLFRLPNQKHFYDDAVKQHCLDVNNILVSMATDLISNLKSKDGSSSFSYGLHKDQLDAISKKLLQQGVHQILSSSLSSSLTSSLLAVDDNPFANINPNEMSFNEYTQCLSIAIVNKFNEEFQRAREKGEEELKMELIKLSNRATISQIEKLASDSELEELRVTTDSAASDVDCVNGDVSPWRTSTDLNQSRSETQSLSQSEMEINVPVISSQIEMQNESSNLISLHSMLSSDQLSSANGNLLELHLCDVKNGSLSSVISQSPSNDFNYSQRTDSQSESNQQQSINHSNQSESKPQMTINNSKTVESQTEPQKLSTNVLNNLYIASIIKEETPNSLSAVQSNERNETKEQDLSNFDVDEDSIFAFATRKKEFSFLPSFDRTDGPSSNDLDLDLINGHYLADHSYGPWSLAVNKRIATMPADGFGHKKTRNDRGIFLPRQNPIERTKIGEINADSMSDTSDESDSMFVDDEENSAQTNEICKSNGRGRSSEIDEKLSKQMDCGIQTDDATDRNNNGSQNQRGSEADYGGKKTGLQRRDSCMQTEQRTSDDDIMRMMSQDDHVTSTHEPKPQFNEVPGDIVVTSGQSFRCRAVLTGLKPIDVFWYKDRTRLDFDDRCTVSHKGNIHSMELLEVTQRDDGYYACIAVNEYGRCTHTLCVKVIDSKGNKDIISTKAIINSPLIVNSPVVIAPENKNAASSSVYLPRVPTLLPPNNDSSNKKTFQSNYEDVTTSKIDNASDIILKKEKKEEVIESLFPFRLSRVEGSSSEVERNRETMSDILKKRDEHEMDEKKCFINERKQEKTRTTAGNISEVSSSSHFDLKSRHASINDEIKSNEEQVKQTDKEYFGMMPNTFETDIKVSSLNYDDKKTESCQYNVVNSRSYKCNYMIRNDDKTTSSSNNNNTSSSSNDNNTSSSSNDNNTTSSSNDNNTTSSSNDNNTTDKRFLWMKKSSSVENESTEFNRKEINEEKEKENRDEKKMMKDGKTLPSVRSLRMMFNSRPTIAEENYLKRNYSLTARQIPNSVVANQQQQKPTNDDVQSLTSSSKPSVVRGEIGEYTVSSTTPSAVGNKKHLLTKTEKYQNDLLLKVDFLATGTGRNVQQVVVQGHSTNTEPVAGLTQWKGDRVFKGMRNEEKMTCTKETQRHPDDEKMSKSKGMNF